MKTIFDQYCDADRDGNQEPIIIYEQELRECAGRGLLLSEIELSEHGDHFELTGAWGSLEPDCIASPGQLLAFEEKLTHNIGLDGLLGNYVVVDPAGRFKVKFNAHDNDPALFMEYEPIAKVEATIAAPDYDGPWSFKDAGEGGDILIGIFDANGDLVTELRLDREPDFDDDQQVAIERQYLDRAKLIAAAPEMYREIAEEIERMKVWMKALDADRDAIEDVVQGMEISRDKFERLLAHAKG